MVRRLGRKTEGAEAGHAVGRWLTAGSSQSFGTLPNLIEMNSLRESENEKSRLRRAGFV